MNMHIQRAGVAPAETVASFIATLRRQSVWWLCPYGEWEENDGSRVIFDRCYRPIVRIRRNGFREILPPDQLIAFRRQRWFHNGFGSNPPPEVRARVKELIERYGMVPELRRRRELLRRGKLTQWSGKAAA